MASRISYTFDNCSNFIVLVYLIFFILISSGLYAQPPSKFIDPGGNKWKVTVVKNDKRLADDDVGLTDDINHEILIRAGQELHDEQEVFLHELMHVCLTPKVSDDAWLVHKLIYRLSPDLTTLLRNNPKLRKYLGKR